MDEGQDRRGPFSLATAFTRKHGEREQRVVVVGDGDFLSNSYVGNGGNLNLGLNLVNWLAADEGLVNIPPRTAPDTELKLSRDDSLLIGFGFLFVLPAARGRRSGRLVASPGALMRGRLWLNLALGLVLAALAAAVAWFQARQDAATRPGHIDIARCQNRQAHRLLPAAWSRICPAARRPGGGPALVH